MKNKKVTKQEKEALVVLGGVIRKKEDGFWRTSNLYEKGDSFGSLGDGLRVKATTLLYKQNPRFLVISSGGKGRFKGVVGVPTLAQVIQAELIQLKVPKSAVIIEDKSNSTFEQLQELKKIFVKNHLSKLIIISNDWHLPRVRAMIKLDSKLNKLREQKKLVLKSAEKILINQRPLFWRKKIDKARQQPKMQKIIKSEKKGIKNLLAGSYIFRKIL